ncbi:hypothetical protein CVIRNUC_008841 [Coccomyxa viridis]|uniref:C2H2-type domain-containing protein n=1 Tax=Coccomyxa viridis TaxID=1274662 RepID=A0AAV1IHX8_9CHLO|nr:hypothetical protein CVIRNUC_008841 [Coccomyxa viridis]
MGKAKPAKHTSAELAAKAAAALTNKGGGAAGKQDRLGGKAGSHAKYRCYICAQMVPDMKTMQVHFEAKHPKLTYEADKVVDMHALMGGSTQGVAIRGSTKK